MTSAFEDFGFSDTVLRASHDLGYETPTPIQQKTIPLLLDNPKDIIALAQTGTGKTAAFGLPLLHYIDLQRKDTQGLVICPTRELCLQITENLNAFGKYLSGLAIVAVYGGSAIMKQIEALKKGAQIIVATPGRLKDLMERKVVHLEKIRYTVLDEADEMLNMGFRDDIYTIFKAMPQEKRVWLFSATMLSDIKVLTRNIMKNPQEISVAPANTTNKNIVHRYFLMKYEHKYESIKRLLHSLEDFYVIIFCRTKSNTKLLARQLKADGFEADYLNGDMQQTEREAIMYKYKKRLINILVATDVAARGIDVADITHVINYELPDDIEAYTHRSGRTARAGKIGYCYSLLTPREVFKIRRIENYIRDKIEKEPIPSAQKIIVTLLENCAKKMERMAENNTFTFSKYAENINTIVNKYSKDELAAMLIGQMIGMVITDYEKKKNIDLEDYSITSSNKIRKKIIRNNKTADLGKKVPLFINIGRKEGFNKSDFLEWVAKNGAVSKSAIGKITLRDTNTIFEVEEHIAEKLKHILSQKSMKGRKVWVKRNISKRNVNN